MKEKTQRNQGCSERCLSSRPPLSRRWRPRRNQARHPSILSQKYWAGTTCGQHSHGNGMNCIAARDHIQQASDQPLHVYNFLLQRKIIITHELNLLNRYLETFQPPHSPNEMDWEPILPLERHCLQQQHEQRKQPFDASSLELSEASGPQQTFMYG
ncbi:predicted protein [Histoplasma capsulatum var. duboisii H88]|uniref:Predicted protein n=2 Tax=Ajellomyces capsulatus TaxID=5037 RepID=F0UKY7_AJEC8|nr:predicted protein [Histoplasma capsulatum H143]EGC46091.1 predicted protein [Histoplasma capsulatum var. duboisii H88]QSS56716.1 hypothetical protein I7I53_05008 [Histoplasma capsulatum var. duboisii H88]